MSTIKYFPLGASTANELQSVGLWDRAYLNGKGHDVYIRVFQDEYLNTEKCSVCKHHTRFVFVVIDGETYCGWCVPEQYVHIADPIIDFLMQQMGMR